jgi:hypothetical protein
VEGVIGFGLVRWRESGDKSLEVPHILLWLLASHCGDPLVGRLGDIAYASEEERLKGEVSVGQQTWQHWEEFVARFVRRCPSGQVPPCVISLPRSSIQASRAATSIWSSMSTVRAACLRVESS